jgi:hypothetical protein
MQILTDKEKILLERYLKKRINEYMNLCKERDMILAMKKYHEDKKDSLISKLEKYNTEIQVLNNEVIEKKLLL